jgi:hypothetical protein
MVQWVRWVVSGSFNGHGSFSSQVGIGVMGKVSPSREHFFFSGRTVQFCEKWKRTVQGPHNFFSFLIGRKFEYEDWKEITLFREVGSEDSPFSPLVQLVSPVLFQQDQSD